jgi:hypothetical protein
MGAPRRKPTLVGQDIKIGDTFHPWHSDDLHDTPINAPQHQLVDAFLHRVAGGTLAGAVRVMENVSSEQRLGMTLGDEKGAVISDMLDLVFKQRKDSKESFVFLEFGSHVGDGTLRIMDGIMRNIGDSSNLDNCFVFSFEANQEWLGLGSTVVRHTMVVTDNESKCRYIPVALTRDITQAIDYIAEHYGVTHADGVLFDHVHANFFADSQLLVRKKLLKTGSVVFADNIKRHASDLNQFVPYIRSHSTDFRIVPVADPYPDEVLLSVFKTTWRKTHDSSEL